MTPPAKPIVIVGAGLAGLSCARHLAAAGRDCVVLEAADAPGGRVRTDVVDGFRLDRGFQVYLTSYEEPKRLLDLDALGLQTFTSGALIRDGARTRRAVDAWRQPLRALGTLLRPALPIGDVPRVLKLRRDALRGVETGSRSAMEDLRARGFSDRAMRGFFKPFFCGVTLDPELAIPASYFHYLFASFARGSASLPREGMQAIPNQLAAGLPAGTLRLGVEVDTIDRESGRITTRAGASFDAARVIIATDARTATRWTGGSTAAPAFHGTTTLYYAADCSTIGEPTLMLDGTDGAQGPVNHVCFPTDVQPSYGPAGQALASVSLIGIDDNQDAKVDGAVRRQLDGWFGAAATARWRLLRVDRVRDALPSIGPGQPEGCRPVGARALICGDALQTPSIEGAMLSGRLAAEAALTAGGCGD